jgi:response regulator RpfG family c-di-GMP phosphodiesterase
MDLKAERKFRVGVLDDSPFETEAMAVLCVDASFEVLLTDNPQEARSWIHLESVDLLILDFHQPAPFNALDFLLREVKGRIPTVLVSADDKVEYLSQCIIPTFVCGFFIKPVTLTNIKMLPSIATVHRLTLAQQRWQPHSVIYQSSSLVLDLLHEVLNERFAVAILSTNTEHNEHTKKICQAVGWGIRYGCTAIDTHEALEVLLDVPHPLSLEASPLTSHRNSPAGSDVDGATGIDTQPNILVLDTEIGSYSLASALEKCRIHRLPVVCKYSPVCRYSP